MSYQAQYTRNVRHTVATLSAANTNRDGSGAMQILWEAPAEVDAATPGGSRIERVTLKATGTTSDGMIRLYVSGTNAANTTANTHLLSEVQVSAFTPSATEPAWSEALSVVLAPELFPLVLGPGQVLRAATHLAESFRVHAEGGDY